MLRCRLIRTVVNLSLIVAMMIQPGLSLVFANDCGAKNASSVMCEDCGCCEVASPEEKCGCCGGDELSAGEESCCESDVESNGSWDSVHKSMRFGEPLELPTLVLSSTEPAVVATSESAIRGLAEQVAVTSTCGCGVESPPLGETAPARPTIPSRESLAIRSSDLTELFGSSVLPRRPSSVRGVVDQRPPHFSQIQLCIWRL